ncbi:MAG: DUF481 domain-containing protein [Bacteroidetes bacterium]|nr:DUF481 domain-containing protein [Bacteroidota bacterium]
MVKKHILRRWHLLSFALLYLHADAQFNDSVHRYINFASTGSINRTNNNKSYLLNNSIRYSEKYSKFRFNTMASYNYGEQEKTVTNNDFAASADGDFYHNNKRFFYWILANYTTSYSLKINNQIQTGAGVAYSVFDTTNKWLNISDGILFEKGDLFIDTLHDRYNTFRNSLRVIFKFSIRDLFIFEGQNYLQNSFSNISDYIVKSNLLLTIKLYKWLGLTAGFNYNKFNRTHRENLFFNYGLKFEKYF